MAIKVGVGAAVVVGAVCLIRSAVINGKAEKLYRQAESLASAGDWVGAVEAYTKVWELNPKYKDVAAKLADAKGKAGTMFIRLGDEAWAEKNWKRPKPITVKHCNTSRPRPKHAKN